MQEETTKITVSSRLKLFDFKELYRYRDLFRTLAERDIKVRYKQTAIGALWAILQPFVTMVVFTVFFGNVAKIPSDNVPYAIFSYSGLLLWNFFSDSIRNAGSSLVGNEALVSKVYFPRIIMPVATTIVSLLDYLVAAIIMGGLMIYFNFVPTVAILLVPLIVIFTWLLASGVGLWLSAINVKYRDVRYAIPFFIRLMLFVTPVIYPVSIAGKYEWLLKLNPMSGFIQAHRAAILNHQPIDWQLLGVAVGITLVIFITGNLYFKSVERYFADVI